MAVEIPAVHSDIAAEGTAVASSSQPWPKRSTAWFAAWVFAIALCFAQLEASIMQLLVIPIEQDFHLNDTQVGLLGGLAPILFYAVLAVPLSRFVDMWPRNLLMTFGVAAATVMTALSGLAQSFWQLFVCRVGVGIGGIFNGPGTYSMMADYFPREKLPRAIAVLQIGFIGGTGIALIAGGAIIQLVNHLPIYTVPGVGVIHHWQLVLLGVSLPGFLIAALVRSIPEPARRGRLSQKGASALPLTGVLSYLWQHRAIYGPQFLALAFSVIEFGGTRFWQATFFIRTYGWTQAHAGYLLGVSSLIAGPIGLLFGTWLTEHFVSKGDTAANLRVVAITYSLAPIFTIATPLMPNPWLAVISTSIGGAFAFGGAVPQNAAMQSVTPNEMRGQVTALYLFVFAVIGTGFGPNFISLITNYVIGDQALIRYALAGSAAVVTPIAAWFMWQGVRPYGEAIRQLKEREAKGLA
ncbi:MAG: MFS transporter [Alphaproteobacteria bacterium]